MPVAGGGGGGGGGGGSRYTHKNTHKHLETDRKKTETQGEKTEIMEYLWVLDCWSHKDLTSDGGSVGCGNYNAYSLRF